MDARKASKKRKAVTRDVEEEAGVFSGDELSAENLDGALSDNANDLSESEDDDSEIELIDDFSDEDDEEEEELDSDEIPSDVDEEPKKSAVKEWNPEEPNVRIVKDANGNERYLYDEINPDDNSDYSDVEENANTIGDIPLTFYDQYPHIGYDINGKKIMRPAKGEALDALLDSIEIPKGWTGLTDPATGKPLNLTQEELELLKKVQMNEIPGEGYDQYEPLVEYFTSHQEIMPLSAAPEPKRRFVPSKHEQKRVMKLVKAIRDGRIQPWKAPEEREEVDENLINFDLWADEQERPDHIMHVPAPKLPPPGYEESYHPPPEYIPDSKERKAWEQADPEDREKEYLPNDFGSLRKVPGYENFVQEKFERCLDLYLAPRVRRSKLNIDPESLLPKLPSPEELKPFPTTCATVFRGHKGRVRSLNVDPTGIWLATGGDDGTVRVWEILTGRQLWSAKLSDEDAVNVVRWRPGKDAVVLAAACGDDIFLSVPPIADPEIEKASLEVIDAGWGYAASNPTPHNPEEKKAAPPPPGSDLLPPSQTSVSAPSFLSATSPSPSLGTVAATTSSACALAPQPPPPSQSPFTLSPNISLNSPSAAVSRVVAPPQTAHFHPSKPILFVANQRSVRGYDLSRQLLVKILQPGARWISSFDIHPTSSSASGGDNIIIGSYDRRLLWHDLDLSPRPYKTLRYHRKAIRAVKFHPGGRYPLFADASDDGSLQIFHGSVTGDMLSNATIVPLKVLKGHKVTAELGILDIDWHPREAWLVSAGADGTCRLWM
ncbi:hypothetical protein N7533_011278 [Penicillium manginii]|uniref:uncharacterized protein n=1 Tax=Penicillium manginii TaxID=203109 RepID=UPI002546C13F|nr:uncharacterized protein N7533_011278 [Penicillium manginii]KAJ5741869.1 hypothetical protein N7533_011278 [Penicillium manginii]